MRNRLSVILPATLISTVFSTAGCNQDVAWASGHEGEDEAGDSTGEAFEPSVPDEDGEEPESDEPEPGPESGVDGTEPTPTPNPSDDEPGLEQPAPKLPPPPDCGNGQLDEGETCDDANEDNTDGCLADCQLPTSCLVIKNHDPSADSGHYVVQPPGLEPFEVYCDMGTDGGGYTFLKMDVGEPVTALEAEAVCADMEMQLLIPRTAAHLYATHWVSIDLSIGPSAGHDYMKMFGIYPAFEGARCDFAPLQSKVAACDWKASDDGPFWISDRVDIDAPAGHTPLGQSVAYSFDVAGHLVTYAEVAGGGAKSHAFICDFGDKQ